MNRATKALYGRTRVVVGQLQNGEIAAELFTPVGQLGGKMSIARQPVALPNCEIGVLDAGLGQRRLFSIREGGVERSQLRKQNSVDRIAIKDDVVQGEEEPMFSVAELHQQNSKQRRSRQIEW